MNKGILAIGVLSIVMLSVALPAANASTLTVNLYPSQNQAKFTAVSHTDIILTYPANSTLSSYLNGYSKTVTINVNITRGESEISFFEGYLKSHYSNITVENMSLTMTLHAVANATTLNITKTLNIVVWVSGIFNHTKNGITANMAWRDFSVSGKFEINYNGNEIDMNEVGSAMTEQMSEKFMVMNMLMNMFGEDSIWSQGTINYSPLNVPLQNWHKSYNSVTDTTNFKYVSSVIFYATASVTLNNQTYTLTVNYDPSATITAPGNAQASGNSVLLSPTSEGGIGGLGIALIAIVVVAAIVGVVGYTLYRRH